MNRISNAAKVLALLTSYNASCNGAFAQDFAEVFKSEPDDASCAAVIDIFMQTAKFESREFSFDDYETRKESPFYFFVEGVGSYKDDFGDYAKVAAICKYVFLKDTEEYAFVDAYVDDGSIIPNMADISSGDEIIRGITRGYFGSDARKVENFDEKYKYVANLLLSAMEKMVE